MQNQLIPDHVVAKRYGVHATTIWRWDRDPDLNFPKPIRIRGRKYRSAAALDEFDSRHAEARDSTKEAAYA